MSAGLFAGLTRPELDQWIAEAKQADKIAHDVLGRCPLERGALEAAAGVAQDCMRFYVDCLDESIRRLAAEMAFND